MHIASNNKHVFFIYLFYQECICTLVRSLYLQLLFEVVMNVILFQILKKLLNKHQNHIRASR